METARRDVKEVFGECFRTECDYLFLSVSLPLPLRLLGYRCKSSCSSGCDISQLRCFSEGRCLNVTRMM